MCPKNYLREKTQHSFALLLIVQNSLSNEEKLHIKKNRICTRIIFETKIYPTSGYAHYFARKFYNSSDHNNKHYRDGSQYLDGPARRIWIHNR